MKRYRVFIDVSVDRLSKNNFLMENFYCETLSDAQLCAKEWRKVLPSAVITISEESSECVAVV